MIDVSPKAEEIFKKDISEVSALISKTVQNFFQDKYATDNNFSVEMWTVFITSTYMNALLSDLSGMGIFIENKTGHTKYKKIVKKEEGELQKIIIKITDQLEKCLRGNQIH